MTTHQITVTNDGWSWKTLHCHWVRLRACRVGERNILKTSSIPRKHLPMRKLLGGSVVEWMSVVIWLDRPVQRFPSYRTSHFSAYMVMSFWWSLGGFSMQSFRQMEKLYKLLKLPIIYIAYSPIVWQHNLDDNTLCHSNLTVTFEETRKCCKCCGKVFTLLILENWFCRHKNGNANKKKKLFRINDGIRIESKWNGVMRCHFIVRWHCFALHLHLNKPTPRMSPAAIMWARTVHFVYNVDWALHFIIIVLFSCKRQF